MFIIDLFFSVSVIGALLSTYNLSLYMRGSPPLNRLGSTDPLWLWIFIGALFLIGAVSSGLSLFSNDPFWLVDKIYGAIHIVLQRIGNIS